jgi:NADP-dependent 3-hydroxy acid dehydrogenase YdfG
MPTIAIVGAESSLGLSAAKVFGRHGFDVALISRSQGNLEAIGAQLSEENITWAACPGDVANRASLTCALERATEHFEGVDVLEFSPSARKSGITTADRR